MHFKLNLKKFVSGLLNYYSSFLMIEIFQILKRWTVFFECFEDFMFVKNKLFERARKLFLRFWVVEDLKYYVRHDFEKMKLFMINLFIVMND